MTQRKECKRIQAFRNQFPHLVDRTNAERAAIYLTLLREAASVRDLLRMCEELVPLYWRLLHDERKQLGEFWTRWYKGQDRKAMLKDDFLAIAMPTNQNMYDSEFMGLRHHLIARIHGHFDALPTRHDLRRGAFTAKSRGRTFGLDVGGTSYSYYLLAAWSDPAFRQTYSRSDVRQQWIDSGGESLRLENASLYVCIYVTPESLTEPRAFQWMQTRPVACCRSVEYESRPGTAVMIFPVPPEAVMQPVVPTRTRSGEPGRKIASVGIFASNPVRNERVLELDERGYTPAFLAPALTERGVDVRVDPVFAAQYT